MSAATLQRRLDELEAENRALRARLADAEQTLEAIQHGQVDALVRISSNEQFVHGLIEKAPIGIAVVDHEMRYVLANPVYRALARESAVTGRSIAEGVAPALARVVAPLVSRVLQTGEPLVMPECAVPNGEESWWNISLVPLHEPGAAVSSVLILAEDISARKAATAALETGMQRLELAQHATGVGIFDWDLVCE